MTVQKFRHVPNEIEAIQYTGENAKEILEYFGDEGITEYAEQLNLTTTHGDIAPARIGDWIVPDSKSNTFYPIKDEVLQDTYTMVGAAAPSHTLRVTWPRIAPDGSPITKQGLREAWKEFMTPLQEEGRGDEENIKTLLAVFRHVYGAMPDDK